jgi:pre-rRNA-processing protein IPI3
MQSKSTITHPQNKKPDVSFSHKIWDVLTQHLWLSISFPSALTTVVMNLAETLLFVGAINGRIYRVDLFQKETPRGYTTIAKESHMAHNNEEAVYIGHTHPISSLAISTHGDRLVSGSENGIVHVWDISSRQIVRSFIHHKGK